MPARFQRNRKNLPFRYKASNRHDASILNCTYDSGALIFTFSLPLTGNATGMTGKCVLPDDSVFGFQIFDNEDGTFVSESVGIVAPIVAWVHNAGAWHTATNGTISPRPFELA